MDDISRFLSDEEEPLREADWYIHDIKSMMYACGDAMIPRVESALLVESVVHNQLQLIILKASEGARRRNSDIITQEDILFLMRKNKLKVHRLLRYLGVTQLDLNNINFHSMYPKFTTEDCARHEDHIPIKRRKKLALEFFESIDITGELLYLDKQPFDFVKHERRARAELMSRVLSDEEYSIFSSAQRSSFGLAKNQGYAPKRFNDWLRLKWEDKESPKLAVGVTDLLGYLAHETVCEIVDLALLVRQDRTGEPWKPCSQNLAENSGSYGLESQGKQPRFPPSLPLKSGKGCEDSGARCLY
uniref:Uncharacterized protein n=1 Tax=Timema bartmani TaxID=61472 RepID=A0A7R9F404_9NEOP|nr:unnamed protein product [Timema bartmani]